MGSYVFGVFITLTSFIVLIVRLTRKKPIAVPSVWLGAGMAALLIGLATIPEDLSGADGLIAVVMLTVPYVFWFIVGLYGIPFIFKLIKAANVWANRTINEKKEKTD